MLVVAAALALVVVVVVLVCWCYQRHHCQSAYLIRRVVFLLAESPPLRGVRTAAGLVHGGAEKQLPVGGQSGQGGGRGALSRRRWRRWQTIPGPVTAGTGRAGAWREQGDQDLQDGEEGTSKHCHYNSNRCTGNTSNGNSSSNRDSNSRTANVSGFLSFMYRFLVFPWKTCASRQC